MFWIWAVLRLCGALWKLRNDLCFQAKQWCDKRVLLHKILGTLRNWQVLCKEEHLSDLMHALEVLEFNLRQPLQLHGSQEPASSSFVLSVGGVSSAAITEAISEDLALPFWLSNLLSLICQAGASKMRWTYCLKITFCALFFWNKARKSIILKKIEQHF